MKVLLSSCVFLLKPAPESSPSIMPTLILLLFLVFFIGGIWLLVVKFYYKHLFESWNKKTRLDMIAKDEAKKLCRSCTTRGANIVCVTIWSG